MSIEIGAINKVFEARKVINKYKNISPDIKIKLMKLYKKESYPSKETLINLSQKFNLTINKIQTWFKDQRKRDYKNKKKLISYKPKNTFSNNQKQILEKEFRKTQKPNQETLNFLKKEINSSEKKIKRWFYYRKAKLNNILRSDHSNNCFNNQPTKLEHEISKTDGFIQKEDNEESIIEEISKEEIKVKNEESKDKILENTTKSESIISNSIITKEINEPQILNTFQNLNFMNSWNDQINKLFLNQFMMNWANQFNQNQIFYRYFSSNPTYF